VAAHRVASRTAQVAVDLQYTHFINSDAGGAPGLSRQRPLKRPSAIRLDAINLRLRAGIAPLLLAALEQSETLRRASATFVPSATLDPW